MPESPAVILMVLICVKQKESHTITTVKAAPVVTLIYDCDYVIWGTITDNNMKESYSVIIIASFPFCHNQIIFSGK